MIYFAPDYSYLKTDPGISPWLFLAGSIENGKARDWQAEATELAVKDGWTILNPRRTDWNWAWEQSIHNPKFKQQVDWELDSLHAADAILMYYDPNTKGPISLMETGLFARSGKMVVVCPEGFWRKGNVDILCERENIPQAFDIPAAITMLTRHQRLKGKLLRTE